MHGEQSIPALQQRVSELESEQARLLQKLSVSEADTKRLDWLESKSDGSSWVARQSNHGRGFRLHNTGEDSSHWYLARGTARAAIDVALHQELEKLRGGNV